MHDQVSFKSHSAEGYAVYSAAEVRAFAMKDGYQYKAIVFQEKAIFGLVLVEGHLSLYQYGDVFYVADSSGTILPLEHGPDREVDRRLIEDKRYVRTLTYLTSDCSGFDVNKYKLSYNALDLIKAVQGYNKCKEPEAGTSAKEHLIKPQFRIGAKTGVSFNNFSYLVPEWRFYDFEFDEKPGSYSGLFLNFTHNNKLSFQSEVLLTTKNASFAGIVNENSLYDHTANKISISLTYIELPLSFYYTLPTSNLRPFVSAGGTYGFTIKRDVVRTVSNIEVPLDISKDVMGIRLTTGVAKDFKTSTLGIEYLFSSNLVNRTYTAQKANWRSHSIVVTLAFLANAK